MIHCCFNHEWLQFDHEGGDGGRQLGICKLQNILENLSQIFWTLVRPVSGQCTEGKFASNQAQRAAATGICIDN